MLCRLLEWREGLLQLAFERKGWIFFPRIKTSGVKIPRSILKLIGIIVSDGGTRDAC